MAEVGRGHPEDIQWTVCGGQMGEEGKQGHLSIVKRNGTGDKRVKRNILLWVACPATWGLGKVPACAAAEGHVWVHGCEAVWVYVYVHGSYYH